VALVAAGCGGDDDSRPAGEPVPTPGPSSSVDGDWIAISGVTDGATIELVEGRDVTLTIDGSSIGGTAACNGYGGEADFGEGSISVGQVYVNEMGCEAPIHEVEQAYIAALTTATHVVVIDDVLTLSSGDDEWVFERAAPVADTELVGTTWVLDTLITGDAASNSPGMDAAFLEFSDDGTLIGSTGCRQLEGEWSLQSATIEIPVLSPIDDPAAGVCAPESEALDGVVITVVESGVTAEIDGNRLTLTAPGGDGLSFQAGDSATP
jgi:heat shock protein HslJ